MTRVKICGLTNVEHALAAARAGADYIGLVFANSRRQVSEASAKEIVGAVRNLKPRPAIVGVFAGQDIDEVNRLADSCRLDMVQLSGDEQMPFIRQVERDVIRVIHISDGMTSAQILSRIRTLSGEMEMIFMLDSGTKLVYGGTGKPFDWRIAVEVSSALPVMVAGGLNTDNVSEMLKTVHPWGVDVSSGVETDGIKDVMKIRSFVRKVKTFEVENAGNNEK
jgi:phosphoribosylanthranilate isomerase